MFPSTFRENEYIRLIALRRDYKGDVIASKIGYVQNFEDYAAFVTKYRYTHDVYNQIATNRGKENGTQGFEKEGIEENELGQSQDSAYFMG